jgi:hypothetical protein
VAISSIEEEASPATPASTSVLLATSAIVASARWIETEAVPARAAARLVHREPQIVDRLADLLGVRVHRADRLAELPYVGHLGTGERENRLVRRVELADPRTEPGACGPERVERIPNRARDSRERFEDLREVSRRRDSVARTARGAARGVAERDRRPAQLRIHELHEHEAEREDDQRDRDR